MRRYGVREQYVLVEQQRQKVRLRLADLPGPGRPARTPSPAPSTGSRLRFVLLRRRIRDRHRTRLLRTHPPVALRRGEEEPARRLSVMGPGARCSTRRTRASGGHAGRQARADSPPPQAFDAMSSRCPKMRRSPDPIRMPGRHRAPRLVHPRDLPRRGFGSTKDARPSSIRRAHRTQRDRPGLGCGVPFPRAAVAYYADWVGVASRRSTPFRDAARTPARFGHDYGDFDAHNGLWEMAEKTAHDGLARMALVPRVLEARGLDVTPA